MTTDPDPALTPALAAKLAKAALGHVEREYPGVLVQALSGPEDLGTPRAVHPIFFGSYDWHSCVHGHWLLARLLRQMPDLPEAPAIRTHFNQAFTAQKVAGELAYLACPTSSGFERPYGWAWLLMLAGELRQHAGADAHAWDLTLRPLADAFVIRFEAFLPKADYPVRAGVHSNTAFALSLAHDYAQTVQNTAFADLIEAKAASWYVRDAACQAWEPSGDDFLSPALIEAELMRRILPAPAFRDWFARFLPGAGVRASRPPCSRPARGQRPGATARSPISTVSTSRAWCWRGIARAAGDDEALRGVALAAAAPHLAASLPHVAGDYMGEHWLASFALLALLA